MMFYKLFRPVIFDKVTGLLWDNQSCWGFAKLVEGLSWGFGIKNSIVVEGSSWGAEKRGFHEGLTWGYEIGSGITPDP